MEIIKDFNMDSFFSRSNSTLDIRSHLESLVCENNPDTDVLFIDKERLLKGKPTVVPNNPQAEKQVINAAVNSMRVNVTRYGKSIASNYSIQVRKHSEAGEFKGLFVKFTKKGTE